MTYFWSRKLESEIFNSDNTTINTTTITTTTTTTASTMPLLRLNVPLKHV